MEEKLRVREWVSFTLSSSLHPRSHLSVSFDVVLITHPKAIILPPLTPPHFLSLSLPLTFSPSLTPFHAFLPLHLNFCFPPSFFLLWLLLSLSLSHLLDPINDGSQSFPKTFLLPLSLSLSLSHNLNSPSTSFFLSLSFFLFLSHSFFLFLSWHVSWVNLMSNHSRRDEVMGGRRGGVHLTEKELKRYRVREREREWGRGWKKVERGKRKNDGWWSVWFKPRTFSLSLSWSSSPSLFFLFPIDDRIYNLTAASVFHLLHLSSWHENYPLSF